MFYGGFMPVVLCNVFPVVWMRLDFQSTFLFFPRKKKLERNGL